MKKHYLLSCIACFACSMAVWGQPTQQRVKAVSDVQEYSKAYSDKFYEEEVDFEQILACPEGTVQQVAFQEGGYISQTAVDANRSDMKSIFYQYYDGCMQTVNKIRLMASFATFDGEVWAQCYDNPILDENGEVVKELPLEIGFYEPGENNRPGKQIYSKTINATGRFTQVALGRYSVYEFTVNLQETLSLYKGWFSVRAAEAVGTVQNCWFTLLGSDYNTWPAYVFTASEPAEWQWVTPFSGAMFCLIGDGSFLAQHAVELQRIMAPFGSSNNKAQKVQIEVGNIGEQPINAIDLELWFDGQKLATETVKADLKSGESYRYTFNQRIDCSDDKAHTLEIKNVTPGMEAIVENSIKMELPPSEYPEVGSLDSQNHSSFIESIKIGTIDNSNTGNDSYHDYSSMKTAIHPSDTLKLFIQASGEYTPEGYGVWVDWNNNKSFNDEEDLIIRAEFDQSTFSTEVSICIPENVEVAEGDVRLRITACTVEDLPIYEGYYLWGETEDYTLTITRNENSPIIVVDQNFLECSQDAGDKNNLTLTIANDGKNELNGKINVNYALPHSPNTTPLTEQLMAAKVAAAKNAPKLQVKANPAILTSVNPEPNNAEFILKYDKGQVSAIGMPGYVESSYGSYYPGKMLSSIKGMQIESVDVFVYDAAPLEKIVIYGQGTQNTSGKVITEQVFKGVSMQWNHVVLDKPVTIGDTDLWVTVKCENIADAIYPVGTDKGGAVEGYGGMINIGGNRWWSLPELGDNTNLCIRANVTGTRTPAINWLALDKAELNIQPAGEEVVNATVGADKLEGKTLYEAVIKITSNDEVKKQVLVPVYMTCLNSSGIEQNVTEEIKVSCLNRQLTIDSEKEIARVNVLNVAGQKVLQSNEHVVSLANVNEGIYLVAIQFADNSMVCVKIIVE